MGSATHGGYQMDDMQNMSALLDELTAGAQCAYLSDLHATACRSAVCNAVMHIPASAYPARVWNDVAHYILGKSIPEDTAEDTRAYLICMLKS